MEWQHWGVIDCIWSFPYINEELFVAVGAHVLVRGHTQPGCFSIIWPAASNHTTCDI
jgi:hypothetical protein